MKTPLCFYGIFSVVIGLILNVVAILTAWIFPNEILIRISAILIFMGLLLGIVDFFILLPAKRGNRSVRTTIIHNPKITVVLTAYNDELSIKDAVQDFQLNPAVKRVIVIDNNSSDLTIHNATVAGAEAHIEGKRGYGHCAYRSLCEASVWGDTEFIVFCQGDRTFRARDIDKLLAYTPHADIVNGTRIVEQLREHRTQLNTFMFYGNFFAGKLIEAKHLGKGTFTDAGCDYKVCRSEAIRKLMPLLNPNINLAFNAHFLDTALENDISIVECPVTFYARVGQSKGGGKSNWSGFKIGMQMIFGLLFGWPKRK